MGKREDDMADSHEGERDDPVELVEQLQIRLPVENQTLEEESSTCEKLSIHLLCFCWPACMFPADGKGDI